MDPLWIILILIHFRVNAYLISRLSVYFNLCDLFWSQTACSIWWKDLSRFFYHCFIYVSFLNFDVFSLKLIPKFIEYIIYIWSPFIFYDTGPLSPNNIPNGFQKRNLRIFWPFCEGDHITPFMGEYGPSNLLCFSKYTTGTHKEDAILYGCPRSWPLLNLNYDEQISTDSNC